MSYRLTMSEPAADGLRRCAAEQLDGARDGLVRASGGARADAVHDARKSIKKTRALLRLAQAKHADKRTKASDAALREVGRTLSGTRDADVLAQVVKDLRERYVGQLPASAFADLGAGIGRACAPSAARGEDAVALAIGQLEAAREDLADWSTSRVTWRTVGDGVVRSYARGCADLAAVIQDPTVDARHDWRKRVKNLWYQERLLGEAWPPILDAHAKQAHLLSEMLGDDHDLAVLHDTITTGRVDGGAESAAILALIDARRDELLRDAQILGRRLYAESPKAFAKRLRAYVGVWSESAPQTVAGG